MVALSPDGTHLVHVGRRDRGTQLYVRVIDEFSVAPIPGTEDGTGPFFSRDGKWLGYFDYRAGKLKKVPLRGGATIDVCDAPPYSRGASWGMDNVIVFTRGITGGLYTVSATGGTPRPLATPDFEKGEKSYRLPQILPGGKAVLFTMSISDIDSYDQARIAVVSLETGEKEILFQGGSNARYAPTGHIVHARAISTEAGNDKVWIYELGRGTMSRLTTAGWDNYSPIWTPDGRRVVFASNRRGVGARAQLVISELLLQLSDGPT